MEGEVHWIMIEITMFHFQLFDILKFLSEHSLKFCPGLNQ